MISNQNCATTVLPVRRCAQLRWIVVLILLWVLMFQTVAHADQTNPDDKSMAAPGSSGYVKLPNGIWVPEGTATPVKEVARQVTVRSVYEWFKMWVDIGKWMVTAGTVLLKGMSMYSRYRQQERVKTELASYLIDRGWTVRELVD